MAFGASPCSRTRPGSGCLSIVKLSRHHLVVRQSLILLTRPAHLAPCHDIRYSRCGLPDDSLVRSDWRMHLAGCHVCGRSAGRYLSIVKLSRHRPVVGRSPIH